MHARHGYLCPAKGIIFACGCAPRSPPRAGSDRESLPRPNLSMRNRTRFPRLAFILTLFLALCAGMFSPRIEQVEAKPLGAADELNVFISEFRVRGPNGVDDEFMVIYFSENRAQGLVKYESEFAMFSV